MTLGPGKRLGSFEILAPIGSGAMGVLYRAKDLKLGRLVAIKVLRPDLAAHPERLRRFEQEARSASALSHPNIVHIYDIDTTGEVPYIAMELVEGRTLREILQEGPLPPARLRELALQTAEGLTRAHEAGIVHRDLKPENLMVDRDGRIRILDFGLAKLGAEGLAGGNDSRWTTLAAHGTRPGMLMGTVEYMSPEQAAAKIVDFRSDQFSFGVLLYEMISGRLPFQSDSAPQTLAAIIEREPPPLGAEVSGTWKELIARLLQKDKEDRFRSAREVISALENLETSKAEPALPPLPTAALPRAPKPTRVPGIAGGYHVEKEGSVKARTDRWLRKKVRKGELSGMEMVRKDGETTWLHLYETDLFLEEVPHDGDPRSVAEWRVVKGFLGHLLGFTIATSVVTLQGGMPWPFLIWGIFVVLHGLRVLPHAIRLLGSDKIPRRSARRRLRGLVAERLHDRIERRVERSSSPEEKSPEPPPRRFASPSFLNEVEKVRRLLEGRQGDDKDRLQAEIDRIVRSVEEIGARTEELEEQTNTSIREKLERNEVEAYERFERAQRPGDKEVFGRQLEIIKTRRTSIDDALRLLDKLAARRAMAEQQLQQLRLDLTRAEALKVDAPELSSRLEEIRLEVEAAEVVDDHLAGLAPEARWALEQALPDGPDQEEGDLGHRLPLPEGQGNFKD